MADYIKPQPVKVRPFRSRDRTAMRLLERIGDRLAAAADPVEAAVLAALETDATRLARRARGERGWTGR